MKANHHCWLLECASYAETDCREQADGSVRGAPMCEFPEGGEPFPVSPETVCPYADEREPASWYADCR